MLVIQQLPLLLQQNIVPQQLLNLVEIFVFYDVLQLLQRERILNHLRLPNARSLVRVTELIQAQGFLTILKNPVVSLQQQLSSCLFSLYKVGTVFVKELNSICWLVIQK